MMLLGKHDESLEKWAAQRPSDDDGADEPGSGLFGSHGGEVAVPDQVGGLGVAGEQPFPAESLGLELGKRGGGSAVRR